MKRDTVGQVKEKLSIVDVVTPYVKLTRAGKYWKGLSPFNKEKTPSFFVNPERGSYYCFSSNQGGDMFTFIQAMEGVDFKGALKILAEKAGVPLEYVRHNPEEKEKKDRLHEAMARAEQYYAGMLTESSPAYAYALSRGLTKETIASWRLGFAPDTWRALLEDLSAAGFSPQELADAGLIKEAEGKAGTWYDRFRNRLMFPIRDAAGRTVAFTGRALDPDDQAKYLNSPETELFKKSLVLFAMDRAKDAIRTRGFALLMEGQLDVLHAHQAGFTNAIGISGTALSTEHLSLMKRYSENLMLCLDADRAGLAATQKHALSALRAGMRVKAVRLPEGKDPADLISQDPKEFTKRVAEAGTIVEFFLAVLAEKEADPHKLVLATERIVLPLVAAIQSPVEREHFVGVVARSIASTPEAVRAALPRSSSSDSSAAPRAEAAVQKEALDPAWELRAIVEAYPGSLIAKRVESEYSRVVGSAMTPEASPEKVLFETGILYGEAPDEHAADDALRLFEKSYLAGAYNRALQELRHAEMSRDPARVTAAEAECHRLAKIIALL